MTRLLITTMYYAPDEIGIAPYAARTAEHLASLGYQVTVLTAMPHYPAWRIDDAYRGHWTVHEARSGVEVRRRRHYVPRKPDAIGRPLYEASFFVAGLSMLQGPAPDAIVGVSPGLGGAALARVAATRFNAPYGVVMQDLSGLAAEQTGGNRAAARIARAVEGWSVRKAALAGIVASGFLPYVEQLGVEPSRIRRLRNWTRIAPASLGRDDARRHLGWTAGATVSLHAGNMGAKQGLENVLHAARIAATEGEDMLFVLVGDGNQRERLEELAMRMRLENVRFMPLQTPEMLSSMLAAADVLLLNQRSSVREMALPSKITSYFASGTPVVAAVSTESEAAREIAASSGGIVVPPDDPRHLLDGIRRVRNDDGLRAYMTKSAQRWAADVLSERAALRSYEQFVAAILASGGRGRVHVSPRSTEDTREARWAA